MDEIKYKEADNGNIQLKFKYLKIVLKLGTWLNVFSCIPSLIIVKQTKKIHR